MYVSYAFWDQRLGRGAGKSGVSCLPIQTLLGPVCFGVVPVVEHSFVECGCWRWMGVGAIEKQ